MLFNTAIDIHLLISPRVKMYSYILILFIFACSTNALNVESLNGAWTLRNNNGSIQGVATVPGGIYSDLMDIGVLDDIFAEYNDINYRWVGSDLWTYTRDFDVSETFLMSEHINLVFDGVDTFSTIFVNDIEIGISENMFVRYIFDVKPHLRAGTNTIRVEFKSAVEESLRLFNIQSENYTVPPLCVPTEYRGECHANHIRKMQASFSWDWGPAFPSVGIWKNVFLEGYNVSALRDFTLKITPGDSDWLITFRTYFANNGDGIVLGNLVLSLDTNFGIIEKISTVNVSTNGNGELIFEDAFDVPFSYVDLWWPNGYGESKLYNLGIQLITDDSEVVDAKQINVGFRTIELIQDLVDQGRSFYFKVNQIPIFMKGTNSIPINILPERGTDEKTIRFLLQSAKDVHMNMIRVWGGGVYESDAFYDIADELGILIWQDFMFACSMYPTNDAYLGNVREEVKHQVRRLQHHASVAIWAGNNENEAALRDNWYGTGNNFELYKSDYKKLYVETIKSVLLENDDSRNYLTSSPTNGIKSEEEDFVAEHPYDSHYGDIHYYNYLASSWDINTYPMTRFASEYGFQSLPRMQTLKLATNASGNLHINSDFMHSRQHHLNGYNEMKIQISYQFDLPNEDDPKYFDTFIYYNQISQAMAIKTETEHYRQWRSTTNSNGEGLTMGALYWQLNDVWTAPTWAGIDFDQNWKMLHYFAKKFFSPVLVSSRLDAARQLTIYSLSDALESTHNASLKITVYKWDSLVPIREEKVTVDVLSELSVQLRDMWIDQYLSESGCGAITTARNYCLVHLSLFDQNESQIGTDNFVFPTTIKSVVGIQTPTINVDITQNFKGNKGTMFILQVTTNNIALFVWLDTNGIRGQFTENGFNMVTPVKYIGFQSEQDVTVDDLIQSLISVWYLK